tara:strand:- start:7384 stop:7596 length:213 start_codon:yes stop_codon:yes gene_type:complete
LSNRNAPLGLFPGGHAWRTLSAKSTDEKKAKQTLRFLKFGAGKEARTPDLNLGKVALYQLSYSRKSRHEI